MSDENLDKTFDGAIRKKIEAHAATGTDELWESISASISEHDADKRKRRFLFYSWTVIGTLAALLILTLLLPLKKDHVLVQKIDHTGSSARISNRTSRLSPSTTEIITEEIQKPSKVTNTALQPANSGTHSTLSDLNPMGQLDREIEKEVSQVETAAQNQGLSEIPPLEVEPTSSIETAVNKDSNEKVKEMSEGENQYLETEDSLALETDPHFAEEANDSISKQDSSTYFTANDVKSDSLPSKEAIKRLHFFELGTQQLRTSAYYKNTGLAYGQNEVIELTDGFGIYSHYGIQLNKRIEIYSGLNFEKTELEQRLETELDNFNFYTAFGEVFIEEENQMEDDFFFVERYFYYLELPIGINYNFILRKRIQFNVSGDLILNYLINQSNRSEAYIKLGNQATILPLTLSCAVGLGAQYNFNKGWSVVSDFRYNLMLNSISSDKDVTIRPYSFGLGVGIKKYF